MRSGVAVSAIQPVYLICLVAVFTVSSVLRFSSLGDGLLVSNEAFCWRVSSASSFSTLIDQVRGDTHPPGYFVSLRLWMHLFGASPLGLRGLSATAGLLTVVGAVALRRAMDVTFGASVQPRGRRLSILVLAMLFAVHPLHVQSGRVTRMYALGGALGLLSTVLFVKACNPKYDGRAFWWIYCFPTVLFCFCHNYACFTVVAHAVFIFLQIRSDQISGAQANRALVAIVVVFLAMVPWLPSVFVQAERVKFGFWTSELTADVLIQSITTFFSGHNAWMSTSFTGRDFLVTQCMSVASVLQLLIAQGLIINGLRIRCRATLLLALLAFVPWAIAIGISLVIGEGVVLPRYMIFSQLGFFGIYAMVPIQPIPNWSKTLLLATALMPSVFCCFVQFTRRSKGDATIRSVVQHIEDHWQAGDVVVLPNTEQLLEFAYPASTTQMAFARICCPMRRLDLRSHRNLACAVRRSEWISKREFALLDGKRLWLVGDWDARRPHEWRRLPYSFEPTETLSFENDSDYAQPVCSLILAEKRDERASLGDHAD